MRPAGARPHRVGIARAVDSPGSARYAAVAAGGGRGRQERPLISRVWKVLLFANVGQRPFTNNLLPPLRAFERVARVELVEPRHLAGFLPTGGARPAEIPDAAVGPALEGFAPDLVLCLAGGLFLSPRSRQRLPAQAVVAGIALSDPLGLEASLAIAPLFDLFYTQDPQTLPVYRQHGIPVRRCDPAVDPTLFYPVAVAPQCDLIFYGKWTPYRDAMLSTLAGKLDVRLHAHAGESRWSLPARPPLDDPEALRTAINGARLAVEFARLDDAPPPFRDTNRITPRLHYAAACGVPSLVETFDRLGEHYAPGVEVEPFTSAADLLTRAAALLADEARRRAMGRRARERALRQHTWDLRVAQIQTDVAGVSARGAVPGEGDASEAARRDPLR